MKEAEIEGHDNKQLAGIKGDLLGFLGDSIEVLAFGALRECECEECE